MAWADRNERLYRHMKKKDYALKLDQQLARIEEIIKTLLDGIVISELTTVQRLFLASRFEALQQRSLAVGHTFEMDQPGNRESAMAAAFRRYVRGDTDVLSDQEAGGVIDAELESTEITLLNPGLDVDDIEID